MAKSSSKRRTDADDSRLVGRCLDGHTESYGVLINRHSGRIINLAFAMVGDRHDGWKERCDDRSVQINIQRIGKSFSSI